MEKKIDLQVEKATQLLNSDSLLSLVNETPFTILAKKFLWTMFAKKKIVLGALTEEKRRMGLFWRSAAFIPLGLLLFFFVPDEFFLFFVTRELLCRVCIGAMLGGIISTSLFLSGFGMVSFLAIPLAINTVCELPLT